MMKRPARVGFLIGVIALLAPTADGAEPTALPEWIWADGDEAASVTLRTRFDTAEPLRSVRLKCAADFCRAEIRLNGQIIHVVEDYAPSIDEDVAPHVARGENVVEVRCSGSDGPSAVAASIEWIGADGRAGQLVSVPNWEAQAGGAGWRPAASLGTVAAEEWGVGARSIEVSAFDDYEQWRRAGSDVPPIAVPDGFEVERVRKAQEGEGSWISLAFDPKGRLIVAREEKGLLRMTLAPDGGSVASVEMVEDSLKECRGLLFAHDSLYVSANNSKGLYRLRDTDGDDRFDEVKLLREFPGGVGHGRNDLALGPDGLIYSIRGDDVEVPTADVLDRTSPFREARRGEKPHEGNLVRTDRDGSKWEVVASGLRNPFGIDFHPTDGEPFTYDADAEHDMGAPWYRPTRLVHLVSGADYGWRGVTGSWPPYYPDRAGNAPPVIDIGKGSPTAVKFGGQSQFPPRFRDSLFILDWAYGRVVAVHPIPRGAGYTAAAEVFLSGRPLNVTDLDFGPDGAMYLVTGGRQTESGLYRIRYVGLGTAEASPPEHEQKREEHSREMRAVRRRLEAYHGRIDDKAIGEAWPYLDHPDPVLRYAARIAVEHQPVAAWRERAFSEQRTTASLTALLALARSGQRDLFPRVLERLNEQELTALTESQLLTAIESYLLCLDTPKELDEELVAACRERLAVAFHAMVPETTSPVGFGGPAEREVGRLLVKLEAPGIVADGMARLAAATSQEERLHWLFLLRDVRAGWTPELRRTYFAALNQSAEFQGGQGMPGFVQAIRDEAVKTLSEGERRELGSLIDNPAAGGEGEPLPQRAFVKEWKLEDLAGALSGAAGDRDRERGRRMFHEAACDRCHRVGTEGMLVGPDLTSVGRRFSRRDVLESILSPSAVIAEPYRGVEVVTTDGRVVVGRVVTSGDYRATVLKIATDPLRPSAIEEIPKAEIELHRESAVSPMPAGLLNTLSREEVLDLLAFLEGGGVGSRSNQ